MFDIKATFLYFCAECKKMGKGKGNMDKNGPYNTKSFRNNRPVAPFFSGNSAIFMPTTTVSHSPILQAYHNTTQSDVTPFVVAIPPQAGLLPNIREYAPNIHKFTPHSLVVIPAVLSIQPSTVSDGLEADKFEDDLVEIEGIWSHVLQSNDEAPSQRPCSCHMLPKGSCPVFLAKIVNQIFKCKSVPSPNINSGRIPLESPSFLAETALG